MIAKKWDVDESPKVDSDWSDLKERLHPGDIVEGDVVHREVYGIFVDFGERFLGHVEPPEIPIPTSGTLSPDDYPEPGTTVRARILQFADWNRQVRLSMLSVS